MTREEFKKIAAAINTAFKKTIESKIEFEIWYENLNDLEYKPTSMVVKKIIQESEFAPKIATIRKEYKNITIGERLSNSEAWGLAMKAVGHGMYMAKEAMEDLKKKDSNVYAVVKAIGFRNLCTSNPQFSQPIFIKMYEELSTKNDKKLRLENKFAKEIQAITTNSLKLIEGDPY